MTHPMSEPWTVWYKPADKLPEDGQECLLMPHDSGGLTTVGVFGPIMWSGKNQCWLDIFRDADAGSMIDVDRVGVWTPWDPIKPKVEE